MALRKIVVIEDETDVREILVDILEAEEFEVAAAQDGAEGIELVLRTQPDLILCDVMMPRVNGLGVLTELRQHQETATTPLIFLTARATKENLREGMNLGADDYVTKPFTRQELLAAINSRLERHQTFEDQSRAQLDELRQSIALSLPHELHTPLNGIINASQLILNDLDEMEKDELREFMQDINTSGQRLYRLIQNFLLRSELAMLAQDETKRNMLRSLTLEHPSQVIQAAVQDHLRQGEYEARDQEVTVTAVDAVVQVADTGLRKVVVELLDNALKFSKAGSGISITGESQDNRYCVTVADQGNGLTAGQIDRIGAYQQFDRLQSGQQGAGLGLSLVQQLLNVYDGQWTIDSSPGQGTTVRVSFALAV